MAEKKIKSVERTDTRREMRQDHWSSDVHPVRETNTYANAYDGTKVCIDENDIRATFGWKRITDNRLDKLEGMLHNKRVDCRNVDGDYWLNGNLADYVGIPVKG